MVFRVLPLLRVCLCGGWGVLVGLLFEICIVDASIFTAAAPFEGLVVVEVIGVAGWFLAGCVECV